LWEEIVHDYPPDYFRNSHKALVRQYVTAELQLREVSALLESDIEGYVVETPQGTKANPLISTQAALASQVRSCARAIRVAPSAQMQSSQIPKTPARAPTAIAKPGRRRLRIAGVEED
jgi:phage terminase small subunit